MHRPLDGAYYNPGNPKLWPGRTIGFSLSFINLIHGGLGPTHGDHGPAKDRVRLSNPQPLLVPFTQESINLCGSAQPGHCVQAFTEELGNQPKLPFRQTDIAVFE